MKKLLPILVLSIGIQYSSFSQCLSDVDSCTVRGSSSSKVRCLQSMYAKYEVLLDQNYTKLISKLDNEHKTVIEESQKDWVKFRDKEFKIIEKLYNIDHGSDELIFMEEYKVDILKQRAVQLQQCFELLHLE